MAVTFNATGGAQTGTTTLTVTGCARTNGDMILMWVHHKGSATPGGTTGWNLLSSQASTSGSQYVYWKWATATGTEANASITGLTSSSVGSMATFTGVDPDSPFLRSDTNNIRVRTRANAEGTYSTLNTSSDRFDWGTGDVGVGVISYDNDASTDWTFGMSYFSGSDLTTAMTEIADGLTTLGTDCGGAWAYKTTIGDSANGIAPTPTEASAGTADNVATFFVLRSAVTQSAVSTLTDDFNDNSLSSTNWYSRASASAAVAETNSRIELSTSAATSQKAAVVGASLYSLDTMYVKVPLDPTANCNPMFGLTDGGAYLGSSEIAGLYIEWDVTNGLIYGRYATASSTSSSSTTYTTTTRAANPYWKITNDGTNVKWWYGDGTTYTQIWSVATSTFTYDTVGWDLDLLRPYMGLSSSLVTTVYFDDFNVAPASGSTTNKTISATQASTPTLVKRAGVVRSITQASTPTIAKAVAVIKTVTQASTPTVIKSVLKPLSLTQASTATLAAGRQFLKVLSATVGQTATMTRLMTYLKTVSASQAQTATVVKRAGVTRSVTQASTATRVLSVSKTFSLTQASTPTLAAGRAFLRTLTASVGQTATRVLTAGKNVSTAQSSTVTVTKRVGVTRSVTQASTATIRKAVSITRTATQASTATLSKGLAKTLSAVQATVAFLTPTPSVLPTTFRYWVTPPFVLENPAALEDHLRRVDIPRGISAYKVAGVWHFDRDISDDLNFTAEEIYRGGYEYPVDETKKDELVALGFTVVRTEAI